MKQGFPSKKPNLAAPQCQQARTSEEPNAMIESSNLPLMATERTTSLLSSLDAPPSGPALTTHGKEKKSGRLPGQLMLGTSWMKRL